MNYSTGSTRMSILKGSELLRYSVIKIQYGFVIYSMCNYLVSLWLVRSSTLTLPLPEGEGISEYIFIKYHKKSFIQSTSNAL